MRTLKESWKDAPSAVEELEKEGEVFVTRTLRDGQMRMVFWNELKADPADLAEEGPDAVAKRDASKNGTGLSVEKGAASEHICSSFTHYNLCRCRILRFVA